MKKNICIFLLIFTASFLVKSQVLHNLVNSNGLYVQDIPWYLNKDHAAEANVGVFLKYNPSTNLWNYTGGEWRSFSNIVFNGSDLHFVSAQTWKNTPSFPNTMKTSQLIRDYSKLMISGYNGYIGIGTSSPDAQLHIHSNVGVTPLQISSKSGVKPFMVHSNGGVSIGSHEVPAPRSLFVNNTISVGTNDSPKARLTTKIGWGDWMRFDNDLKSGYWAFHNNKDQKDFQIYHVKKDGTVIWPFNIGDNGVIETMAIGINTSNTAGHQLAVAGSIVAERIYCKLQANWPDFVFADKYKLISLDDVECFINENQHLPGVPSASKVKADDGINVGEMNAVLLQKIEELTLYLIEQNKKIAVMQQEINSLK